MTENELCETVRSTAWFSRVGHFTPRQGYVAIPSLEPWAADVLWDVLDPGLQKIAAEMDWLPTSRDAEDPIHGSALADSIREAGRVEEFRVSGKELYQLTLTSMRLNGTAPGALVVRANSFTEAAKGAALYATRHALMEVIARRPAFWCNIVRVYNEGFWPCGLLPTKEAVVF